MTDAPSKSFTSRKLNLLHRALSDARLSAAQFRYFVRALKGCNHATSVAVVSDQAFIDDVPGCSSRDTAKAMRKQIATLGYFTFKPGIGRRPTEYTFDWKANGQIETLIDANARRRKARRAEEDKAWRDGVTEPPLGKAGDGVVQPPLSARATARHPLPIDNREGVTGPRGDGVAGPRQKGSQDPVYTFRDTPSPETPSYRLGEESRYLQPNEADPPGVVIPSGVLSRLGGGDVAEGRRLAQFVPSHVLAEILETAAAFGASRCAEDIAEAREIAFEAQARRATA